MENTIQINQGEIKIKFNKPLTGKLSFADLGIEESDLFIKNGFMRLVIDIEGIGEHNYYQVPTIEVSYKEKLAKTHWQCDFNDETILDKIDNFGNSTVMLMDRKKIKSMEHHHENKLILHAEFPDVVHIVAKKSYIHLFK